MCQPEKPLTLDGYDPYHEQPDNVCDPYLDPPHDVCEDLTLNHHEEIRQLTSRETIELLQLVTTDDGMRAYILSLLRGAPRPYADGIPY